MNRGITQKQYLELVPPTEEDARSSQMRILDALKEKGITASFTLPALQKLYPICDEADYNITVSLAWNGSIWQAVDLEAGDTAAEHYGYAADLGSTTVVVRLVNCSDGTVLAEESEYNRQTAYGTDILTRIFACKDKPEVLQDIRACTMETFTLLFEKLRQKTGIVPSDVLSMVVSGNTTMIHFLLGLDPFCVFSSPYAVRADRVGFLPAKEMGFPMKGCVYCVPGKSNYLGGDILSGMIATELYKKETISVFFDIGTNGELVVGNQEFLLCGAGAAGPALEGGVVKTGMRAAEGAVDTVKIEDGKIQCHVIGEGKPKGICGSGIIDLLAELFLNGWINLFGTLQPERSEKIKEDPETGEWCVEYSEGLCFYQSDIAEFLRTKSAAYTMVEYMMRESGISMEEIDRFYAAGAFGKHVSKESAITIGIYPDLEYTLPNVSQSVVITRMAGRTPVPEKESIESFAAHHATMVVFLSTGLLEELSKRLIAGGYTADTPAAIVYKATWEDEKSFVCTVGTLAETARKNNITKTALMIIGDVVAHNGYDRSKLYDPGFTTEFRKGTDSI